MNENKEQTAKEKAAKIALKHGMTLVTRDLTVWGLLSDGTEKVISKSETYETRWQDALKKLDEEAEAPKDFDEDELHIFTDGGSRGNPGPSASGYVILTPDGQVVEEGGEYLGITTNNQAEYQAVKLALESANKYNVKKIKFFIDSLLVVNQMNGVYKIKNRDLWPVHEAIKEEAKKFDSISFTHVYREKNKLADAKVNEILDSRQT